MILESLKDKWDFELLDTGDGYRLERWGEVILSRPDPQIIWSKSLPEAEWDKAWAIFVAGGGEEKGRWQIKKPFPSSWSISFKDTKFQLKLSPFKHTGIFAEQAAQWEWMVKQILNDKSQIPNSLPKPKILNLFAYTGGATMVLAKAGCQVTHVDASKPAITWANENYKLNFNSEASKISPSNNRRPVASPTADTNVRWMLDDAVKFVKREIKRGVKYEGIIMDPPAFGHSPSGKTWKFNNDVPGLLEDCTELLSPNAQFLLINAYATNSSALAINNLLEDKLKNRPGKVEYGELCLEQKSGRKISTGIFARWSA